jgi:hypothetical protein
MTDNKGPQSQQNSKSGRISPLQQLEEQRKLLAKPITGSLKEDIDCLRQLYASSKDVIFHEFKTHSGVKLAIVYIDGMTDIKEVDAELLRPLKNNKPPEDAFGWESVVRVVTLTSSKSITTMDEACTHISAGDSVLLHDGEPTALVFCMPHWESRAIEEPEAEIVVRGPREGFVETLRINTAMLRRRLQSPAFQLKTLSIGRYTKTKVAIAYMEGITDPSLIEEMENRLSIIDVDGVIDSNMIEEMIEDEPLSPFPQLQTTERPDVVSAALLEGRIAVLINGTPITLVAPATLFSMMQSPEDFYQRSLAMTGIRWLRFLLAAIAIFMPSLYVAILSYHQEMIPTTLLLTISKSREQIPFPALVEALLMEITFEALREAGIRLPKQVGAAVSIVGALVIGQAAISAGIVSSPMIMVVAITGVASFLIPNYSLAIALRIIRFPMILSAGILGLYGIVLSTVLIIVHLLSLRSFGVPYLSPISPLQPEQLKETLIRAPRWALNTRPHFTGGPWNKYRLRLPKSRLKKE